MCVCVCVCVRVCVCVCVCLCVCEFFHKCKLRIYLEMIIAKKKFCRSFTSLCKIECVMCTQKHILAPKMFSNGLNMG